MIQKVVFMSQLQSNQLVLISMGRNFCYSSDICFVNVKYNLFKRSRDEADAIK